MTATLFKGTTWNSDMWNGADHEFNPLPGNDWNIAHVRNTLANTGTLPPDRVTQSVEILDALLSNCINDGMELRRVSNAIAAVRRVHAGVGVALAHNDILRVKALIIDWEKEYVR